MSARLNPLDEGHRPSGLDDAQWLAQVTARRRDLPGALAETVLDRRLSPLEHTAIDIALADVVRTAEVPVLPLVVDRLLEPDPVTKPDSRLARSEEHTSELQSLLRTSYAVFFLQKKN